jgi:FAD:protein FMN transferase
MTSSRYLSVSVVAPRATDADALSTAFSLMPLERTQQIVGQLGITAYFTLPDGSRLRQSFDDRVSRV